MKSMITIIVFVLTYNIYAQEPIGKTQVIAKTPALKCVSGDCVDGWGKWEFNNGYYEGFWVNGKKEGYGLYKWDEFGTYRGFWLNDTMEGWGSYEDKNGSILEGMYNNGMLNGLGTESSKKDNVYKRGIYKGHNLVTPYDFITNEIELGCTAGNCVDSYGRYEWDNGDIFTGFFKNSTPFLGLYKFFYGDIYDGMFNTSGQFHGQGRFFYANNNGYYAGDFVNGNFNGKGYYHDKDYNTKIGVWENGKLIKQL